MIDMLDHMVEAVADGIRRFNDDGHAISEEEILERARNIVQGLIGCDRDIMRLLGDRERCIYWLLRCLAADDPQPNAACTIHGVARCLRDMDYAPGSDRARRMLSLGEAGRHLPRANRSTS